MDIEELLKQLNDEVNLGENTEEKRARLVRMLQEFFNVSKESALEVVNKEMDGRNNDWSVIAKQIDELPPGQKEKVRQFLASIRQREVLRQSGAKHVLSGMAGGPGGPGVNEGGPPHQLVSKEQGVGIRNKIVQAIAASGGTGQVDISPDVWVSFSISPGWEFYRVNYNSRSGAPAGFVAGPGGYIAETNLLDECVHLLTRCMGHRAATAVAKEAKSHPLAGFYARPPGGKDVS